MGEPFRPVEVNFGATVARTQATLKGKCGAVSVRRIDPPFLPDVRHEQTQIDRENLVFAGRPRHAEFVFGDDALQMVWIMVERSELDTVRAEMTEAYGKPVHHNARYLAFRGDAALRLDKFEVLFYSPRLRPAMEPDFQEDN